MEAAAPCTTAKAKPPEPPAKKEKKKEKEKDRKRRKESRRRRSKDPKRSHRSQSRSRGRRWDRRRSRPAARLVLAARPKLRSPKRPRSPSTGPTTEQRAALLRLRLARSKGIATVCSTSWRWRGQRDPAVRRRSTKLRRKGTAPKRGRPTTRRARRRRRRRPPRAAACSAAARKRLPSGPRRRRTQSTSLWAAGRGQGQASRPPRREVRAVVAVHV